jgi:hypothetical protein
MAIGAVEYVVIGFSGDQLGAQLAPALASLDASGAVRVLDVLVIAKDSVGDVEIVRHDAFDDRAEPALAMLDAILCGRADGLVTDVDALYAAEELAPGSTAALVAWVPTRRCGSGRGVQASVGTAVVGPIPHEPATVALADLVSAGHPGRAEGLRGQVAPGAAVRSTRSLRPGRRPRSGSALRACRRGVGYGS